ncbi:acyl-CoA thioesterase [Streptomyces sp. NRRL F-5126]|uniref:acyl-CoA thioesterase n=1 Tax=Streptomyces sp. NRRL F-5126 TaxID=1463857 RepID=UPI0004C9524C|nr:hotdog domain-containing protein [Streptomyces sp. NRRL F-5126]
MEDKKSPADSTVTLAHIMSAHDTNLYGTVHGGVVMKLVDDAAGAAAARHAGCPAVTASVDRMSFIAPARVGDLLTVNAQVEYAGRTSMDVGVRVTAERWNAPGPATEVVTAHLTFVAVDADGTPHAVPALVPVTPEERALHEHAAKRRAERAASRAASRGQGGA